MTWPAVRSTYRDHMEIWHWMSKGGGKPTMSKTSPGSFYTHHLTSYQLSTWTPPSTWPPMSILLIKLIIPLNVTYQQKKAIKTRKNNKSGSCSTECGLVFFFPHSPLVRILRLYLVFVSSFLVRILRSCLSFLSSPLVRILRLCLVFFELSSS